MNEHIKSLLLNSRNMFVNGVTESNNKIYIHGSEENLEKFAELIIKECYEHCKGQLLNSTLAKEHNLSYNDGVADCAIGLLLHFGVER